MASEDKLKQIVEAALLAAGRPLSLDQLLALFEEREQPEKKVLREVLNSLMEDYQGRGIEVVEVGSGFRIQVRAGLSPWVSRLWVERPPKYSRALLETLALIAYRQPITRGEIEDIRGVSVSSNIIKTLTEREWVRVVGHRDVPGKPALYATTREFLDYFNLKSLNELPTLAEIRDLDSINRELELSDPDKPKSEDSGEGESGGDAETDDEMIAEDAELLAGEVEGPAPAAGDETPGEADSPGEERESGGDAETDEEVIAEDSELLAEEVEGPEPAAGDDTPREADSPSEEREEAVQAAVESSDNVIELETELKKPSHESD